MEKTKGPRPTRIFVEIRAGNHHTCGLTADGPIRCWGRDDEMQCDPPDGAFEDIALGEYHSCALERAGAAICWGDKNATKVGSLPTGPFQQIDMGFNIACGVRLDGDIACQQRSRVDDAAPHPVELTGPFPQVSVGTNQSCGIKEDGTLTCWGYCVR